MKKTILIVDDHELFRAGIVGLLSAVHPDFNMLEASSGEAALRIFNTETVSLIILDYGLPDTDGLALLKTMRNSHPEVNVILLTGVHSGELVKELTAAGAYAVLAKRGSGDELLAVMSDTFSDVYVSDSFQDDIEIAKVLEALTPRERETLTCLADGLSTRQIADKFSISFKTAETHRTRVMNKLGVHSYGELLGEVRKMGLIQN
jgi:DNA-binding NarL/FixJ family response regulator